MGKKKNSRRKKKANPKPKKKLTAAQKRARREAKAERQAKYEWVFMHGKQVRVKRRPTIDGMDADEFIRHNADPIWLHQNEMWEYIRPVEFDLSFDSSTADPGDVDSEFYRIFDIAKEEEEDEDPASGRSSPDSDTVPRKRR